LPVPGKASGGSIWNEKKKQTRIFFSFQILKILPLRHGVQ